MKIAVVGISAELPSGAVSENNLDHEGFYEFLLAGYESYTDIPAERLNIDAWHGQHLGQIRSRKGSFLKNVDLFDNVEFGVSKRDAQAMSPSTRKLIEQAFLALLDSGIDYRARNVGCFAAGVNYLPELNEYDTHVSTAGPPSMIANRISYHLDLTGPSIPLDTACSSTCSAFHLACNSLRSGDCEAAIVAGCQLNLGFLEWFHYSQASLLAGDGKCKPFDASADGFSRGEGVVAVVLKPLADALKDNDHIYATVLGTALTSTGSAAPPGAPVAEAQCLAMKRAFLQAGRIPKDVDYVECHATGTSRGDPEEVNWVIEHFGGHEKLWLGSVKGNIGHTEITAFLASLSKVVSILQHGVIPPTVNLTTKNPGINWHKANVDLPLSPEQLPRRSGRSLVAIASSGIGGANGHVVLESAPNPTTPSTGAVDTHRLVLLTAGGLSPRSSALVAESIVRAYRSNPECLSALAFKSGRRTRQMIWRTYNIVDPDSDGDVVFPQPVLCPREGRPIVFLFSGQGPQYLNMGRELFSTYPAFRESVLESDRAYSSVTGKSLIEDFGLFGAMSDATLSGTWPIEVTLPALATFQMAMFDLSVQCGIRPDIVLGHSAGETAVLYACGAGTKEMVISLAIARGKAFATVESSGGTMAALSCNARHAQALIDATDSLEGVDYRAEVACFNAPDAVAISGSSSHIKSILDLAASQGILGRKLRTNVPIHSSMIELCATDYKARVAEVFSRYPESHSPQIPTYSSVTGSLVESSFNAEAYWVNARSPVKFTQTLEAIAASYKEPHFVEISPHPVLSSYVASIFDNPECITPTAKRPPLGGTPLEQRTFLHLVGRLLLLGCNGIDFSRLCSYNTIPCPITLDPYPFQPRTFPLYREGPTYRRQIAPHNGPLNQSYLRISAETHPCLAEHVIRNQPMMCAAGFLEMAFEFGASILTNVKLHRLLPLSSSAPLPITIELNDSHWAVKSISPPTSISNSTTIGPELLHAEGCLSFGTPLPSMTLDIHDILLRCPSYIDRDKLYTSMEHYNYGPIFRRVVEAHYGLDEALALIRAQDIDLVDHDYRLHPAILDACFHIACHRDFHGNSDPNTYYLPDSIGTVVLHSAPRYIDLPHHVYAHCKLQQWRPDTLSYNITICDQSGHVLYSLQRFEVKAHLVQHALPADVVYQVTPQTIDLTDSQGKLGRDLNGFSEPANMECTTIAKSLSSIDIPLSTQLWDPDTDVLLRYEEAGEMELQWCISGLDDTQSLTLWVTSYVGRAGDEATGISRVLRKEYPAWTIRLAIFPPTFDSRKCDLALRQIPAHCADEIEFLFSDSEISVPRIIRMPTHLPWTSRPSVLFSKDKVYMLAGGVGSLGVRVALWMYKRGARCIILSSRSGSTALLQKENKFLWWAAQYLQAKKDLYLKIVGFDAADTQAMRACIQSLPRPLGGCFLMTNSATDGLFVKATEEDFSRSYRSTLGAFRSLASCINLKSLQFIIIFSSISAVFGNAGQSPYASSKLVVDGMIKDLTNACSFVCPPIGGSMLVQRVQQRRPKFMATWQSSFEDLFVSIEDIIYRLNAGQNLNSYIPSLPWDKLAVDIGMTKIGAHLLADQVLEASSSDINLSNEDRLIETLKRLLDISAEDIDPDVPLTSYGLDSLLASRLSLSLRTDFSVEFSQLRLLANASLEDLRTLLVSQGISTTSNNPDAIRDITQSMAATLSKYIPARTADIPVVPPTVISPHSPMTILITGTTGTLGTHLLQTFSQLPHVVHIYALQRRSPRKQSDRLIDRQRRSLLTHGLPAATVDNINVSFIEYEPGLPMMGLPSNVLKMFRSSVTHIIHNAWKSNFVEDLSLFEDLIADTRSLLDLARASSLGSLPDFIFISTTGVCQFVASDVPVPEEPITLASLRDLKSLKPSDSSGYLQSKWVAEELIIQTGMSSGIRTCVVRTGLLSGSKSGAWDTSHWFPAMIKSALFVGCLPTGASTISWLPVHLAALAISEITQGTVGGILHLVHPNPANWSAIINSFADTLDVPLVSYADWLERLESDTRAPSASPHTPGINPAINLLDFFRQALANAAAPRHPMECLGLSAQVGSQSAQIASNALANLRRSSLTPVDASHWLAYWKAIQFMP